MSDYGLVDPTPDGLRLVEINDLKEGDNFMIEGEPGKIFRATSDYTFNNPYHEVVAETEDFEPYVLRFGKSDLAYAPKLFLITAVQPAREEPSEDSE